MYKVEFHCLRDFFLHSNIQNIKRKALKYIEGILIFITFTLQLPFISLEYIFVKIYIGAYKNISIFRYITLSNFYMQNDEKRINFMRGKIYMNPLIKWKGLVLLKNLTIMYLSTIHLSLKIIIQQNICFYS